MTQAPTKPDDPKEVAKAMAQLEVVASDARRHWALLSKSCQEQMAYAKQMQQKWLVARDALKAFKDDINKPENNTYVSLDMLYLYYTHWHRMVEIEFAAYQRNIDLVAPGQVTSLPLVLPLTSFEYLEAKARKTLALSRYYMRYQLHGVDAILRATDRGFTITPVNEADKALREGRAAEIKAAATLSAPLHKFLSQVGVELRAVKDMNRWAREAFDRYATMDAAAKAALVRDPNWEKMEARFPLLQELHERSQPFPVVNQYTAKWTRETLPFKVPGPPAGMAAAGGAAPRVGTDQFNGLKPATGVRSATLRLGDPKKPT